MEAAVIHECGAAKVQLLDKNSRAYNDKIDALRHTEYPILQDVTYLDHAGTTLYSKSLIDEFSKDMMSNLLGNPHSASSSSQLSTRRIESIRLKVLRFFNASPDHFEVVFVANATAGIKLVMESFRESRNGFWYGYHRDAHTSMVGVREAAGSAHRCFESDEEVERWIASRNSGHLVQAGEPDLGLFAYPAQSNMNGRRLPLDWCDQIRKSNKSCHRAVYSLLDAAAFVSTSPLDLSNVSAAPDFTVLSFYKIFGFPDLGALLVRKASGHVLRHRKYFGGGTVEMVTCLKEQWHIYKENSLHERLEDGTLPIHNIMALDSALGVHETLFGTLEQISFHTTCLADRLYKGLKALRHSNGSPVCRIYQDPATSCGDKRCQGPVIAFNLRNSHGIWTSNAEVEKLAAIKNIHLRSGGLCNPGGIASSLDLSPWEMKRNFSAGQRCGNENENDIIGGKPTGVIRVSLGAMSTLRDVQTFLDFIREFFVNDERMPPHIPSAVPQVTDFYVETLMIYPIKSCAGWRIPYDVSWDIRPEGLAWDREWCLVRQGSLASLSQKRYPKMALLKPSVDFNDGVLRVRYTGALPPLCPSEITVPLSEDPSSFEGGDAVRSVSRICGDPITAKIYTSKTVTDFFTAIIGFPCYLARFPAQGSGPSLRHIKPHLQKQRVSSRKSLPAISIASASPTTTTPILFSNESPILVVSRSSLNRLNEAIKEKSPAGKAASAEVFRANIILAEDPATPPGIEQPYIEDTWQSISLHGQEPPGQRVPNEIASLDILGPCRRCQMVCVDQGTGEKNEEPFVTLAKTRRVDGKVFFGMHAGLAGAGGRVMVGDKVQGLRRNAQQIHLE